jgi:hypothetical protein
MNLFDAPTYPWHRADAQQLYDTLLGLYPRRQEAMLLAQRADVDTTWIDGEQAPAPLWKAILEQASINHRLRPLVQDAHDRLRDDHPARTPLGALLAGATLPSTGEARTADGAPRFVRADDSIGEKEALLFRDDLTLQIGHVPALIGTLQELVRLAPAVCKVTVDSGKQYGTGFRIGPDLLLTNWHVVHVQDTGAPAGPVNAEFGYEDDGTGGLLPAIPVRCSVVASDRPDDWAVLRAQDPLRADWPVLALAEAAEPQVGDDAFIIQHPYGAAKRIGFVRNQITLVDERVVHYLTDTQVGSSGSPVLDSAGRLIALHHAGGRPQEVVGKPPLRLNEGIRIPRIAAGIAAIQ